MEGIASVKVIKGSKVGKEYKLGSFPVTIGTHSTSQIPLRESAITSVNLQLKKRGNLFILEDIDSKHNCYLNDKPVVNSILRSGDQIRIGNTVLLFEAPASIEIPPSSQDNIRFVIEGKSDAKLKKDKIKTLHPPTPQNVSPKLRLVMMNCLKELSHTTTLKAASDVLVTAFRTIEPSLQNVAALLHTKNTEKLVPISGFSFNNENTIVIEQRGISQTLDKRTVFIKTRMEASKKLETVFLPMTNFGTFILIFQCKAINAKNFEQSSAIFQEIVNLASSHFQALILQNDLENLLLGVVETIVAMIEAKDTYTVGHSERVRQYALAIADELKLDQETKRILAISARFHDIGKVAIPDAILKKRSLLRPEEYEEMKLHPTIGAGILSPLPQSEKFIPGIAYHHEKWNGSGYPEGLTGEDIPFFARIIAVADAFDAMISGRSYSGFMEEAVAIDKLKQESKLFDPKILNALVRAWDSGKITQKTDAIGKKAQNFKL